MKRAVLLAMLAGCASEIADVEPVGDYTAWKRIDTYGDAPGHGNTYRIIYINPVAELYDVPPVEGQPTIPFGHKDGAIVVKEVRDRVSGGPGDLQVIEVMRYDTGRAEDGGWLFTAASTPGGEETVKTFCWRRCHQAAPFGGAWFNYSK